MKGRDNLKSGPAGGWAAADRGARSQRTSPPAAFLPNGEVPVSNLEQQSVGRAWAESSPPSNRDLDAAGLRLSPVVVSGEADVCVVSEYKP